MKGNSSFIYLVSVWNKHQALHTYGMRSLVFLQKSRRVWEFGDKFLSYLAYLILLSFFTLLLARFIASFSFFTPSIGFPATSLARSSSSKKVSPSTEIELPSTSMRTWTAWFLLLKSVTWHQDGYAVRRLVTSPSQKLARMGQWTSRRPRSLKPPNFSVRPILTCRKSRQRKKTTRTIRSLSIITLVHRCQGAYPLQ